MNYTSLKKYPNILVTSLSLIIFLFGIWSLSIYGIHILRADMQQMLLSQQSETITAVSADLDSDIDLRLRSLEKIAEELTPAMLSKPVLLQSTLEMHTVLQSLFNTGVFVTGNDGVAVAGVPTSLGRVGTSYRDRDYIVAALVEGKTTVGSPVIGKHQKTPVFSMAAPIRTAQGSVIGAIVGVTNLGKANFLDRITTIPHGLGGSFQIIAPKQRLIITATDKKRVLEALPPSGADPFTDRLVQGSEGSGVTVSQRGISVLASTKIIPSTGWSLMAQLPTAEAFAPINSAQNRLVGLTLVLTLAACSLAWWNTSNQQVNKILEQQVAERTRELQKSRDEWVRTFNAIPDRIMILDASGNVIHANEAVGPLLSAHVGSLPSPFCHVVTGGETPSVDVSPWNSSVEETAHIENIFAPSLNRYFQISVAPFYEDGTLIGTLHIARDITEIKKSEAFERFRSYTLELLSQNIPLNTVLEAVVRGTEGLNPTSICSILLLDAAGEYFSSGVAPNLPDFYNEAILGVKIGQGVGSCGTAAFSGMRVIVDDIATHPYWASYKDIAARAGLRACWSQPILSNSGKVLGTFAIYHRDVCNPLESEIMCIEQAANLASIAIGKNSDALALRFSEQRFRSFVENANDVLFVLSEEGEFIYVSPQWRLKFGYELSETINRPFVSFVHPDEVMVCETYVHQFFGDTVTQGEVEYRMRCKDDRYVWYNANASVETDQQSGVRSLVGMGRDISERKYVEEELRTSKAVAELANAAKSQFLSNMSHEIRTPLNAIIGFSSLILNSHLPPREHNYAGRIHAAGGLLLTVIDDILDFSKIDAQQLHLERVPFRSATVIENVISIVQQNAADKGLSLHCDISREIAPRLIGDPHRLSQILVNLLGNAVKFTEDGEVALRLALQKQDEDRQQLVFSVSDTGIGLSPEQIGKLFQPFTQADESTTRRFGGTGLGLSISKQLVGLMEGEIWCESEPGRGSTFSFTSWFGVEKGEEGIKLDDIIQHVPVAYDFSNYRILLVEDNEVNQQVAIELLAQTGVTLEVASNGAEAVALITGGSRTFDLVLMDIQMPLMDGYEATRLIRGDNRFSTLPIIAMTAHALLKEQQQISQAGMNAHITKPIDTRTMLRVINIFLGTPDMVTSTLDERGNVITIATDDVPVIAGVNVMAALDRLDGNLKLYKRLIHSFVENKAGIVTIIMDGLMNGDSALAGRTAHTLKSSAGTIGAEKLQHLAQILERAISQGEPLTDVTAALESLAAELERVTTTLNRVNLD